MSYIGKKMMMAAAAGGEVSIDDSFENWSGGEPVGWTVTETQNGEVSESTSTGVTDGSSAVKFFATGTQLIAGNACEITQDFDLTNFSSVSVDFTDVSVGQFTSFSAGSASSNISGTGTKTLDISGETGVQEVRFFTQGGAGDGKTAADSSFETYWDNLVFT